MATSVQPWVSLEFHVVEWNEFYFFSELKHVSAHSNNIEHRKQHGSIYATTSTRSVLHHSTASHNNNSALIHGDINSKALGVPGTLHSQLPSNITDPVLNPDYGSSFSEVEMVSFSQLPHRIRCSKS
jgi:hypothetical protein